MMDPIKIAYVVQMNPSTSPGVGSKISDQADSWTELGCRVRLFALTPHLLQWDGWCRLNVSYFHAHRLAGVMASRSLRRAVEEFAPSIVYFRLGVPHLEFFWLAREVPIVVEVNADLASETRITMNPIKRALYLAAVQIFIRRSAGVAAVTKEIADKVRAATGRPTIVTANGIRLDRVRRAVIPNSKRPRFVFTASHDVCGQGIDLLVQIASNLPDCDFDVVGPFEPDAYASPKNIRWHGFVGQDKAEAIIGTADVAIGPLAFHRKMLKEACPLRVRLYLAKGLPVVLSYRDTDCPAAAPHVLQLNPSDDVSSWSEAMRRFAISWKGRRVDRAAIQHIDTRLKERKRVAFLSEIARESTAAPLHDG